MDIYFISLELIVKLNCILKKQLSICAIILNILYEREYYEYNILIKENNLKFFIILIIYYN